MPQMTVDELLNGKTGDAETATAVAEPPRAEAPAPRPPAPRPAAFDAGGPSLAERLNVRLMLFLLVVLVPVGGLGYVYFKNAASDGITAAGNGYKQVDFQKMVNFTFDQRNGTLADVPAKWRALDGQKVILDGEIAPGKTASGTTKEFDLVWSVSNCCMTGSPQVQHFVHSKVAGDGSVRVYRQPVRARGTLRVDVTKRDGDISGVYWLDVESLEPLG